MPLPMQQTLQTDVESRPKCATAAQRDGKRSRWFRILFTVGVLAWVLEWYMVEGINFWTGPYYGVMIYSRGDLMWETVYRPDTLSVEVSVWRVYDETMQAAPLVLVSTGKVNRVYYGDRDNW